MLFSVYLTFDFNNTQLNLMCRIAFVFVTSVGCFISEFYMTRSRSNYLISVIKLYFLSHRLLICFFQYYPSVSLSVYWFSLISQNALIIIHTIIIPHFSKSNISFRLIKRAIQPKSTAKCLLSKHSQKTKAFTFCVYIILSHTAIK